MKELIVTQPFQIRDFKHKTEIKLLSSNCSVVADAPFLFELRINSFYHGIVETTREGKIVKAFGFDISYFYEELKGKYIQNVPEKKVLQGFIIVKNSGAGYFIYEKANKRFCSQNGVVAQIPVSIEYEEGQGMEDYAEK